MKTYADHTCVRILVHFREPTISEGCTGLRDFGHYSTKLLFPFILEDVVFPVLLWRCACLPHSKVGWGLRRLNRTIARLFIEAKLVSKRADGMQDGEGASG